jgi:DNA-binding Xre family transcriptional regulator
MTRHLTSLGRITILLGRQQASTGERWSLRRLAAEAAVPKDLIYRLDAGQARQVDLAALARLCETLNCELGDVLIWKSTPNGGGDGEPV